MCRRAIGLLTLVSVAFFSSLAWADDEISGSVRTQWTGVDANTQGPLAQANARQAGFVEAAGNRVVMSTELKGTWKALSGTVTLQQQRQVDRAPDSQGYVNEGYASHDGGAWQFSAGKKVVAWDVGYGFRPNDVVQQEERRPLLSTTAQGRPLLMAEYFTADTSWSLVWVNPTADPEERNGQEPAFATRYYRRDGAFDWHGFARVGAHTGASLGAAMAWVPSDQIALHGSLRVMQQHDGWGSSAQAQALLTTSPWHAQRSGAAAQALIGATWSSTNQTSVLIEAWWDGTALDNPQWDAWNQRNRTLADLTLQGAPSQAVAGNLAWQANAFAASANLRRANVFVRWSQSIGAWTPALDLLYTPADGGRIMTASSTWQGDRMSLSAGVRVVGGPADSVLAQLPTRQTLYVNGVWSF